MIGGNDPDAIDVENHHHGFVWEVPFFSTKGILVPNDAFLDWEIKQM